MGFHNEKLIEALKTHVYICSQCGEKMHFEDENEDILVCDNCGHSVDLECYGLEDEEDYRSLYPTYEEVIGEDDKTELLKRIEAEDDDDF